MIVSMFLIYKDAKTWGKRYRYHLALLFKVRIDQELLLIFDMQVYRSDSPYRAVEKER